MSENGDITMNRAKEDQLFKRLGMTRRKARWSKERKVLSHYFSEIALNHISKDNQHKMSLG
jgi:hypothetical protein